MRIATWNVNSVRQRLDHLLAWLQERSPDIVCLQEIKCVDEAFPREPIEALGYNVVTHGQKTFNGVALLSKYRFDETTPGLDGDAEDLHARFLEGVVSHPNGSLRIACLYLPNGNPVETEKYPYKIKWMDRLIQYSKERMKGEQPLVLAGDFNVIPANGDVYNPAAWANDALFLPKTRERYRAPAQPRPDRCDPRRIRSARPVYVLGLSGRSLAEEQRHPHRPPAAVTTGQRPSGERRH